MENEEMICSYKEKQYLSGTELLDADGRCIICLDGRWEEKMTDRYSCRQTGLRE